MEAPKQLVKAARVVMLARSSRSRAFAASGRRLMRGITRDLATPPACCPLDLLLRASPLSLHIRAAMARGEKEA